MSKNDMLYASVNQDDLECSDGSASTRMQFSRGPDADGRRAIVKKLLIGAFVLVPYVLLLAVILGVGKNSTSSDISAIVTGNKAEMEQVCAAQRIDKLSMKRNVYYDSSLISRPQRYAAVQQKGATLWFTGLSGSGKSTVGRALEKELLRRRVHVYRLDGDNVRIGLNRDLSFSEADRAESVRRVGEMSALFSEAGVITLVALVSPFRARRDEVRELHKKMNIPFYEVFVDVPVSVAADRDVKGLYKRAIKGEIKDFTGISSPYEEPLNPEIHLFTANMTLDDEVNLMIKVLEQEGLLTGVQEPPKGYPGVAVADGGNAVANFTTMFPDAPKTKKPSNFADLPRVLLRDEDVNWLQVIGEGWAAPLRGFMREGVYLQSLHFSSVLYDTDNLTEGQLSMHTPTNFSEYSTESVSKGKRVNMPVPIVLPINEATKTKIGSFSQVVLVSPAGDELALLNDPEIFAHRKEERITRTFGAVDNKHPYIREILLSGDYLLGGEIELLKRVQYHDDLDQYRLSPAELRKKFEAMNADVVLAFQTRNPTHAGHAYLMNNAREQLIQQGYKNPVLWLSPLGGWTKEDDVPLDVRVRQHEAILRDGMLDKESTVLAIWPSPMVYAGPREVQWHAKSRKNAGASFFVVGRDPAGIKRSDGDKDDIYNGDHGRFVLHMAPGMEDFNILSFSKVYYDVQDHKMKPMDKSRKQDFLSISGSRMRQMARDGLQKCEGDKIPDGWEKKPTCVPQGFMVKSGWDIMIDYYQNRESPRWIPFATQFAPPVVDSTRLFEQTGTFGRPDYKMLFKNDKGALISPWHDILLQEKKAEGKNEFNFVVEIPKGVAHKMEVNKEERHNPIMQDTTHGGTRGRDYLYGVPVVNYGVFPQTWDDPSVKDSKGNGGDNDPLDVVEIGVHQLPMGSVNPVKVLGSLELVDQGEVDHKILVISLDDPDASRINSVDDLKKVKPGVLEALVDWLKNYKIPEGKKVNEFAREEPTSSEEAIKIIMATHERWQKLKSGEISVKDSFFLG
jgi:3'-phosphoadenosine 5'-phosphosulfate synthase